MLVAVLVSFNTSQVYMMLCTCNNGIKLGITIMSAHLLLYKESTLTCFILYILKSIHTEENTLTPTQILK